MLDTLARLEVPRLTRRRAESAAESSRGTAFLTRPAGPIDPWARRINLEDLVGLRHERHRGHDRVKVRDLGPAILGVVPKPGSAQEVALGEAVSKLVDAGFPIGTEPGADGGVWWVATAVAA